jgi:hypothetical protein
MGFSHRMWYPSLEKTLTAGACSWSNVVTRTASAKRGSLATSSQSLKSLSSARLE